MTEKRLNIIHVSHNLNDPSFEKLQNGSYKTRLKEMQAKFERRWLKDPESFNPLRNCLQIERLERTWQLLIKHNNLIDKQIIDIGCGSGVFSRRLSQAGAHVEAVDIAENALKRFKEAGAESIQLRQETMPYTTLPDHAYDIIICTELIAELPRDDYRLFFAELSRLIKAEGYLICSTDIDIDSIGGTERLIELAKTEFDLIEGIASYHALYLRLKRFLESPSLFIKGWKNRDFREKELASRQNFSYGWFWLNTTFLFTRLWYLCDPLTRPFRYLLKNNRRLLLILEKMSQFIWDEEGISHYLFIAKRRSLEKLNLDPQSIPLEKPKRKEVWD